METKINVNDLEEMTGRSVGPERKEGSCCCHPRNDPGGLKRVTVSQSKEGTGPGSTGPKFQPLGA